MPYLIAMAAEDRQLLERLRLGKPIIALLNGQSALILDIGIGGAFVEHYGELSVGDRMSLVFRWKSTDVEIICKVVRTEVVRRSASGPVSHSDLSFVQSSPEAQTHLNDMLATYVGKILSAQKANAAATEDPTSAATLADLGGARRSRARGFVTYRLRDGAWSRTFTDSAAQPEDGFTVAGYEDESELRTLCDAYAAADDEGRRLIRVVAELSARTVKK